MVAEALAAFRISFIMLWTVLWPLTLGFVISAVVQTLVSKRTMTAALGHDSFGTATLSAAFGAASSSCSYAAVSVARTLFRQGATFTNAIVFEFASTNLVFELSLALLALLGWPFLGAEFGGGLLMMALIVTALRLTLKPGAVLRARRHADRGLHAKMEGHGAMDMSVTDGPLWARVTSGRALTAISHYFVMDVASLGTDLGLGFLIAGALAAWVPKQVWLAVFLTQAPGLAKIWGPLVGPVIALVSFVCSVGNIPLAAVLWNGGISFGGVVSFIFADLIILPIVNIHRKYYGTRMSLYLLGVSYTAMALAGLVIEGVFGWLGWIPAHRQATVIPTALHWNITTWLDVVFLIVIAALVGRFKTTGGPAMLRAMSMPAADTATGTVRDPVCGMRIGRQTAPELATYGGHRYHFCSADCRTTFDRDPGRYARGSASPDPESPWHE
jgi:hypothetical protein